ncbi:MAG: hypothetical protein KBT48_02355, partial [Firmicutes bacterium]|nr:hypothetical protein [Bacillota bacterium]
QVAKENTNLLVKDPLGINGDVSKLSKLVKAVYGNDYPVTKENRKQFAVRIYIEPVAVLRFEKKKPVLYEAYDVSLHLVENKYVLANEDYKDPIFEIVEINNVITDDVLKSLGWKATLRLPTVLAGNNSIATIEHYDGKISNSMDLLEKFDKKIQSTGNGKYVELKVSQTSPFVLTYSKKSNNNQKTRTGVSTNISLWISLFVVSAGLIVVLIKKKRV